MPNLLPHAPALAHQARITLHALAPALKQLKHSLHLVRPLLKMARLQMPTFRTVHSAVLHWAAFYLGLLLRFAQESWGPMEGPKAPRKPTPEEIEQARQAYWRENWKGGLHV